MSEIDTPAGSPRDTAPPFTLSCPVGLPLPVLVAVPHGGRHYGEAILAAMRDPETAALRLEDRYIDHVGEPAAAKTGAALIVAHAARAIIDLNRAPEDIDWAMVEGAPVRRASHSAGNLRARQGLGLVPRRVQGLGEVWKRRLPASELETRIAQIHRPYHQAIEETLEQIRDRWGHVLLLDLHSMPPLARGGTGNNEGGRGAEVVIGDRFGASCAAALSHSAIRHLEEKGRVVAHNRPYSGGYALDRHAAPRRGIHAMQLEICRSTYLDTRLEVPGPRLAAVTRLVAGLIRALAGELAAISPAVGWQAAAE